MIHLRMMMNNKNMLMLITQCIKICLNQVLNHVNSSSKIEQQKWVLIEIEEETSNIGSMIENLVHIEKFGTLVVLNSLTQ